MFCIRCLVNTLSGKDLNCFVIKQVPIQVAFTIDFSWAVTPKISFSVLLLSVCDTVPDECELGRVKCFCTQCLHVMVSGNVHKFLQVKVHKFLPIYLSRKVVCLLFVEQSMFIHNLSCFGLFFFGGVVELMLRLKTSTRSGAVYIFIMTINGKNNKNQGLVSFTS